MFVINKFLKPVVDLSKEEVKDEHQSEEALKIYTKLIDNSIHFLIDACIRFSTFIRSLIRKAEELNNIVKALREKMILLKQKKCRCCLIILY